ncbi:MAG: hypothetical protein WCJ18_10310, partial [Planctomycetota bacterium]
MIPFPFPTFISAALLAYAAALACANASEPAEGRGSQGRLHWDTSDEPGLQGGGGTWDADALAWNPAADGSAPRVAWRSGASAVFTSDDTASRPRMYLAHGIEAAGIEANALEVVGGELQATQKSLVIESRREIVLSCGVSGAEPIALTGSGSVVLTRPIANTGGWAIRSGTLRFFDQRSLGTGTVAVFGNATLAPAAANIVVANPLRIEAGQRLVVEFRVAPVALAGPVSGGGELVAADRGSLALTGPWESCRLTVTSGTVSFSPPQPAALVATIRGGLLRPARDSLTAGTSLTVAAGGAVAASGACEGVDRWAESGWITADSAGTLALDGDITLDHPLDLTRLRAACPKMAVGASGSAVLAFADRGNYAIRLVDLAPGDGYGSVRTVCGCGIPGYCDGSMEESMLREVTGMLWTTEG